MTGPQRAMYDDVISGPRGEIGNGAMPAWLYHPAMGDLVQRLGAVCRFGSSLSDQERELAILVALRHWGADVEWDPHERIARAAGLDEVVIDALDRKQTPVLEDPRLNVIFRFATALLEQHRVPDELYAEALSLLGAEMLVELAILLGYYSLASLTVLAFEITP